MTFQSVRRCATGIRRENQSDADIPDDFGNEKRLLILFVGKSRSLSSAMPCGSKRIRFLVAALITSECQRLFLCTGTRMIFVLRKCASCLNIKALLSPPVLLMKNLHAQQHKKLIILAANSSLIICF